MPYLCLKWPPYMHVVDTMHWYWCQLVKLHNCIAHFHLASANNNMVFAVIPGACMPNPCANCGKCVETPHGGFRCYCRPGWMGKRCDIGNASTFNIAIGKLIKLTISNVPTLYLEEHVIYLELSHINQMFIFIFLIM